MSDSKNNKTDSEIRAMQNPAHQHTDIQPSTENSMSDTAQGLISMISALRLPDNYTTTHFGRCIGLFLLF